MENPQIEIVAVAATSEEAPPSSRMKSWLISLQVVAIIFWLYTITKLFVFDVDVYLVDLIDPRFLWLLNYKLPILLGLIVIAMLITRSINLGLGILYIVFYPFVFLLWKIPRFIWGQKSWLLAFAFVNAAISLFRSFRRDFVIGTSFLICAILIINFNNRYLLYAAAAIVLVIVGLAYFFAFMKAFRPSAVFQAYINIFPAVRKSSFLKIDPSIRGLPIEKLTTQQIEVRTNGIQNMVLYNRACLLISRKLRDYQRSGVNVASYILSLVFLLAFTAFSFALINYALFKLDPSSYQFTYSKAALFSFVYYSGGSMFYASNGLVPVSAIAQGIQLVQFLCGVLLLAILITVFFALRDQKYAIELDEVIKSVDAEGRIMEGLLQTEFNFSSIDSAIEALQKAKAGLAAFIIYLTNNLGE